MVFNQILRSLFRKKSSRNSVKRSSHRPHPLLALERSGIHARHPVVNAFLSGTTLMVTLRAPLGQCRRRHGHGPWG